MLVTFTTNAYSDITMFGTAAVALLKLMGQSGNVPGAILAADVPAALKSLREGLAEMSAEEALHEGEDTRSAFDDEEEEKMPIGLHTRAGPLISLLEAAAAANQNVLWNN